MPESPLRPVVAAARRGLPVCGLTALAGLLSSNNPSQYIPPALLDEIDHLPLSGAVGASVIYFEWYTAQAPLPPRARGAQYAVPVVLGRVVARAQDKVDDCGALPEVVVLELHSTVMGACTPGEVGSSASVSAPAP